MTRRPGQLAARRRAMGYTQETFAHELEVDRTTVGRWERGESEPQPEIRLTIARLLGVSVGDLAGLLAGSDAAPVEVHRETTSSREPIGDRQLEQARAKVGSLLTAERAFGGAPIASLAEETAAEFDRRLRAAGAGRGAERDAYAMAAELYEVTGWFLVDAGRDKAVRGANNRALHYCGLAGDRSMEMLVTQNISMHAVESGNPVEGLTLARSMQSRPLSPRLATMFSMREARALAALGDDRASDIFGHALSLLQDGTRSSDPSWTWWIDDDELCIQGARLYLDLGDWRESIRLHSDHLEWVTRQVDRATTVAMHALCMADMAFSMGKVGAWRDLETVVLDLLNGAADISPRAYPSIRRLTRMVEVALAAPASVRDLLHMLTADLRRTST